MRILFSNNSFPGQFEGLAGIFASRSDHSVLFASSYGRRDFSLPGVRRVLLKGPHDRAPQGKDELTRQWAWAVHTGKEALRAFRLLAASGFEPDMVLFSAACGENLFLKEAFPTAFRVAYLDIESFAAAPRQGEDEHPEDERKKFALLARGMTLLQAHAAFALSGEARHLPAFLRSAIGVVPPRG